MADKSCNGVCVLPISRIKTIMKSSPEVSNISQESLFLVSKSTEYFIKDLATTAFRKRKQKDQSLDYTNLATIVNDSDPLQFLQDVVPHKVKVKDYYASTGRKMPKTKEEKEAAKEEKKKEKKPKKGKKKEEEEEKEEEEGEEEEEEKDNSLNENGNDDEEQNDDENDDDDDSDDVQIIEDD